MQVNVSFIVKIPVSTRHIIENFEFIENKAVMIFFILYNEIYKNLLSHVRKLLTNRS